MTKITQKIKIKNIADVGHHMFTISVLHTPPLTEKNTSEFPVSIVLMLISLNYFKMLVMTEKKFKFDRLR